MALMSMTVMQRQPMLSKKVTVAFSGVPSFHMRVSKMLDGKL
jgi:hypothetical protein